MIRCKPLRAAHDSGPRTAKQIKLVVLHSTEGGTAESVAEMFSHESSSASTQIVVDLKGCYRMVPDLVIPWGAPGANESGLHVEHCGFARWTRRDWLVHMKMLDLSAQHTARWCHEFKIPRRYIGPVRIRLGFRGFCRHLDVTRAFRTPGGHTDPGPGFPLDLYMELVKKHYEASV